jgi:hypothetical protein
MFYMIQPVGSYRDHALYGSQEAAEGGHFVQIEKWQRIARFSLLRYLGTHRCSGALAVSDGMSFFFQDLNQVDAPYYFKPIPLSEMQVAQIGHQKGEGQLPNLLSFGFGVYEPSPTQMNSRSRFCILGEEMRSGYVHPRPEVVKSGSRL